MRLYFLLGLFLFFAMGSVPAQAAEPKEIGKYGQWLAYTLSDGGKKVCYMVSQPIRAEGKYKQRGDVYALITHSLAENTTDVFSYIAGYSYKADSDASVIIDGKKYDLFTQDDTAWARDTSTDKKLAAAIRSGSRMVVKGTSARGTDTSDTYSLKGTTAAYNAISKECGVK